MEEDTQRRIQQICGREKADKWTVADLAELMTLTSSIEMRLL